MLLDITLPVTPELLGEAWKNTDKSLVGHLGTHFDVMDQTFPLEYTQRKAVVFDVSHIRGRDIAAADIDLNRVEKDMFVAFYTGFIQEVAYGSAEYFKTHPQLAPELVEALIQKQISIIGLDCAGIRRAPEHVPADRRCAQQGVFVVENLWDLKQLLPRGGKFVAHTYPMRFAGISGIPCRVVAQLD